MEPIDYVRAILRRWPLIVIGALIGAAFAFLGTDPEPEPIETSYQATHTLLADATDSNQSVGTITFAQVPVFATTGEVPRRVAEQLEYDGNPASLAARMIVETDQTTGVVRFTMQDANADQAVRIVDAFADETVSYLAERQQDVRQERETSMLATVEQLEEEIQELDDELRDQAAQSEGGDEVDSVTLAQRDAAVREYSTAYEGYRALVAQQDEGINLTTLERAQPVQIDTGGFNAPRTRASRVPIAASVGAAFGAGLALLAERLDAKLRNRHKAEDAFGAAVVGEIPTMTRRQRRAKLVVGPDQHHAVAEAFRSLRTSITFMAAGGQPLADDDAVGVVLIASPAPGEGKTTIAANLAAAFAETGRSVVVVNADVRRPALGALLTDRDRPRLPAGLAGINRLDPTEFLIPTTVPGVDLLDLSPIGASPGDITRATVRLVAALRDRIDVILIDTPPLAVTTEALEFVPGAEVVVLVGRMGRTTVEPAKRAGELIRFGGAEQIAVVLTVTGSAHLRRKRYYGYYGKRRAAPERKAADEHIRVAADDTGESRPNVEALPVLALGPPDSDNGDQATVDVVEEQSGQPADRSSEDATPVDESTSDAWGEIDEILARGDMWSDDDGEDSATAQQRPPDGQAT